MTNPLVALAGQPLPPIAPIVIGMLVAGGIGAAIGKAKGRVGLGLILGMFLGLIGWIIVAVLPLEARSSSTIPRRPVLSDLSGAWTVDPGIQWVGV